MEAFGACFGSEYARRPIEHVLESLKNEIKHVQKNIGNARKDLESERLRVAQDLEQAKKALADFNLANPRDASHPLSSDKNFELHRMETALGLAELRQRQYEHRVPLVQERIQEQLEWIGKTEKRVGELQQVHDQYQAAHPAVHSAAHSGKVVDSVQSNGPTPRPGPPAALFGGKSGHEPEHASAPAAAAAA